MNNKRKIKLLNIKLNTLKLYNELLKNNQDYSCNLKKEKIYFSDFNSKNDFVNYDSREFYILNNGVIIDMYLLSTLFDVYQINYKLTNKEDNLYTLSVSINKKNDNINGKTMIKK